MNSKRPREDPILPDLGGDSLLIFINVMAALFNSKPPNEIKLN